MPGGWPLVGRDEEMAIVSDAIAPQGSGGVVVAGVAGVGKTRLAREALARAQRQGRHCHWISATTSGRSVPLGAFSEFARDFGPDPLRRVQEVLDALIDGRPPMSTVVGVDDAHLLDEQSALVVHQLVQRGCATVVLTHRSGELAPDAISSLWKDERLPRMELQPLAAEEVGQLLEQALGGVVESLSTERLWRYTHGNVLYLRQLVGDETAGGRLYKRSGVWVWDGHPDFSPTLLELIESNIGRQTGPIIEVLDIVALADPVELPVLLHLTSSEAVDEAQQRGLIRVDDAAQVARLAHPMFGEVRRARAGPIRLRQLRGRLAHTIGQVCATSLHQTVRRAVLMLESDADHDPALLQEAAAAALQLLDMKLAVRLAHAATECGGGRAAELNYAFALASAAQGRRGEELLSRLAASATDAAERAQIALARAGNLAWNLCDAVAAERELDAAQVAADACGLTDTFNALRASCLAARGKPAAAVALADAALSAPGVAGFVRMLGMWGQVYGLADLGDLDQMSAAAAHAYAFARTTSDASHLRFGLGIAPIDGLRLAGELEDARAVATQLGRDARDVEASRQTTALMTGLCELAAGNLDAAQRHLRESAALASEFQDESPSIL
ncbi:MAG TPA: AAA family ATPase [Mycobacterium sp.]|nr:AAA family ATPase [Mycobacterium sp.]